MGNEGSRFKTSAWIPESIGGDTLCEPSYDHGARGSFEQAALVLGLFVSEAVERHPADWSTTMSSAGEEEDKFRVCFRAGADWCGRAPPGPWHTACDRATSASPLGDADVAHNRPQGSEVVLRVAKRCAGRRRGGIRELGPDVG